MKKSESQHHAFIKRWTDEFMAFHGVKYFFTGRDATVVKEFIENDFTEDEVITLAKIGWSSSDEFVRTNSSTLHSFPNVIKRIAVEAARPKPNNHNI